MEKRVPAENGYYVVRCRTGDGKEHPVRGGGYMCLRDAANRVVNESMDHPSGPAFLMYAFGYGYYGMKDCISILKEQRTLN